jgi:xanthine/CO dehydrogenase XdhC/CoxF family maturation factor
MTLFSLEKFTGEQPGTCLFYDGTISKSNIADKDLLNTVFETATSAFTQQSSFLTQLDRYTAFCEWLRPPVSINIVGAGNDAFPLVDIAAILGWQITIIDGRATHANRQRFPKAHNVIVSKADEAITRVKIDESTVFILMTHNYNYDITIMRCLLQTKCQYIGSLGPKKRLERLLNELREEGLTITDEDKERIYGPTGLDIGAESPEEIALSIVAEIKAALAKRHGTSLRNKPAIHPRAEETKTISWQQK